ncbi:site-specific recombinase XerD [Acidovorax sp. CF316]|uniref:site-specific integrase n=1 Tax=Acidovorax sp. CF316 TaxID=1144317 RepID=UPI00026BD753|nr:site-specific integrase [Acidovorax sp. CF316]EJE52899.1 site-specific recombinase XerD [Acidovorax sp. CF316]
MRLPALKTHAALQPGVLSDVTALAVDQLLREGESANTLASYRSALRYWAAWFNVRYGQPIALPLPPSAVLQFVVDHAQRTTAQGLAHELPAAIDATLVEAGFKGKPGPMALSTLLHRVSVLSKAHQVRGMENPCQDAKVRELLSKTRRAYAKRGDLPQKKNALTRDPLMAILATCDASSLKGLRDRALLLFAFASGGRRRSEVSSADMKHLRQSGPAAFVYTLAHSKTNQAGADRPENHKPIQGMAGEALQAWLAVSGIAEGAIFRRVRKGGRLGEALSAAAVRGIVQERAQAAGLPDGFSAHSLRSGFVTEAATQKVPMADTMAMTGHRSVASLLGYFRASDASPAARLLEEDAQG